MSDLHRDIDQFLSKYSLKNTQILKESILSLMEMERSSMDHSDLKMVNSTLQEFQESHRIFSEFKKQRKVCIFGSARTPENHPNFALTELLAKNLTQQGYMVITGAGPGIMEAGNKGSEPNMSFGLNIMLPFEQSANPYILDDPKLISYKYFFTRKLYFIKESHASILLPGGFGTHDEGFEVLTLIQTGKCAPRPIVLITHELSNYWDKWETYIRNQLLHRHYISEEDMGLFKITHSAEECIKEINDFYYCYHSVRYFGKLAVMRTNFEVSQATLEILKEEFEHLIEKGSLCSKVSTDVPEDMPIYPDKFRVVFHFNKVNYGGLTRMIKRLNQLELKNKKPN